MNDNIGLRNELEYFFYAKWPVASISDPQDPSRSRYAMLSAIPAFLVESFNQRIDLGLPRKADPIVSREELEQYQRKMKIFETVPEWTIRVAPLKEPLVIPHDNEEVLDSSKMSGSALSWQPNYPSLATAYSFHFMPVSLFWVKGQDQHKWRLCHYLT